MAGNDAAVLEAIRDAVGQAGAHGVFGEAVTQDGVTVLPVARLSGGGGGGSGEGTQPGERTDASGRGNGGGFGVSARPVGAFVIRDGTVQAVINTITGDRAPLRDGFDIRRAAAESRIPCFTSLDTARAAITSVVDGASYNVRPLPEYRKPRG